MDLSPEALLATLDLSNLENVLTPDEALALIKAEQPHRYSRRSVLDSGYPGYDTSVGWFNYDDETIRDNAKRAIDRGFDAMKLKVGSKNVERDIRRAFLIRETVGTDARIMLDVNQQRKRLFNRKYFGYRSSICRSATFISAISPDVNFPIFFRNLSLEKPWMWLALR